MTTSRRHLTHALMIAGLALGAWAAGEAAHQDAAHADRSAAAEQPGGLLGGAVQLPEQASDRAQDVIDEVAPGPAKPTDKPKPKPTKDPKPTHAPKPPTEDEPSNEPVEVPPVVIDLPPVVVDPPPVTTPPVALEPAPTLPAPIPTPTLPIQGAPTSPVTLPAIPAPTTPQPQQPTLPAPAEAPPLPPALAALLGPAAPAEPTPALTDDNPLVPALIASLIGAADCYAPLNDLRHNATDGKTPSGGEHRADTVQQQHSLGQPCPGHPGAPDTQAITALAVKPPAPTGEQLVADSAAGTYSPALQRLSTLRPRGDLPAGRWPLVEPGPA